MLFVRKIRFSEEETRQMRDELDGYVWLVLDVKRGILAAGDEFVTKMRLELLRRKCSIYDIFGVGLDLDTGKIDYYSPANIKMIDRSSSRELPDDRRERVETLVGYFFSELPILKARSEEPRYSKRVKF